MADTIATRDVLTESEAISRAQRVSDVSYELSLDLAGGQQRYRGHCTAGFALQGEGSLFLDFEGEEISELILNGSVVESPAWDGHRLTLPPELLAPANTLSIRYRNEYDHTGAGFHQFIDPEDGEEYLYSNFEPFSAHRLFPCFDQPDIKATYRLRVTAPSAWEVVHNVAADESSPSDDGRTRHEFGQTERFSTYLFALVCGPYAAFRDRHGDIALGFFCRRSLAPHLDQDELFEITKQGLDFFGEFFDYPYPFGKYDQIFVPEFNAGAMENIGAVTFAEVFVFRDRPTDNQRLNRAEVILHEMAHMWFGDLVTMRWWNDLWLNESFATYMSYLALDSATRFEHPWQVFNSGMKNWAYRQDQLVTTHPIAGDVADTDQTFLNFDGITYGKGAAAINQLVAAMGLPAFRSGMRRYFRRHEYGNTTLSEFLDALEAGLRSVGDERDLHAWARLWLETPSLNTLATSWESRDGLISAMQLEQTTSGGYETLRPHTVEIALVRGLGGGAAIESVPATLDAAAASVPAAVGHETPELVFPNHEDHDFVKVALDRASIEFIRAHLERIDDPLLRQLIWQALWMMVRDQQLPATDYVFLAAAKVTTETNPQLVEATLQTVAATVGRYVPDQLKADVAHSAFELAWQALNKVEDPDLRIIWSRALINFALSDDDISRCARLADGELSVPGVSIDQNMRWEIAVRSVAMALPAAWERVLAELERDPSDRGQRQRLRAETSVPDRSVKEAAWERFLAEGYGSLHLTRAAMSGFHWWCQRDLLADYTERFFQGIASVFEAEENEFSSAYFASLFPTRVEQLVLSRSEELLATLDEQQLLLQRMLRESNDDLARALRCRALVLDSAP